MVGALKAGKVSKAMYDGLEDYLKQHDLDLEHTDFTSPEERQVLEEAIKNVDERIMLKKKQLALALEARLRNEKILQDGAKRPVLPGQSPVMETLSDRLQAVQIRKNTIAKSWGAPLNDFFQRYAKGKYLGNFLRHESDRDKFGQAMMNPKGSDSALHNKLASEVQKVMNQTVMRRADAGLDIRILSHYGLPTNHDGIAIGKGGFNAWADSARRNFATIGGTPVAAIKNLPEVLKDIFDSVRAQHAGLEAGDPMNDHRVIGFGGDYGKWKAYNKDFGMSAGDPVNAIESHLQHAASQAAQMEEFGPKPAAMVRHLRDFAFKEAAEAKSDVTSAHRGLNKFDDIWRGMTQPDSAVTAAGAMYSGLRGGLYIPIAGKAFLSQLWVDMFSRVPTLKMINNLPTSTMLNMWGKYLSDMTRHDAHQLALVSGVASDNLMGSLHKGVDEVIRDHPITGRVMAMGNALTDATARVFLAHAHMETLPERMGLEFLSNFARWKDMAFEDLPIRASMERAGIVKSDWDVFRQTPVYERPDGIRLLRHVDMENRTDLPPHQLSDIATRIGMYVNGEARESVPAPNMKNRYALTGNFDRNSLPGMIVSDATIALSFAMSTLSLALRGMLLRGSVVSKAAFLGSYMTILMAANAARLQSKALASGRDFYDMDPTSPHGRSFWVQDAMTSGFTGPVLDLLGGGQQHGVFGTAGEIGTDIYHYAQYQEGDRAQNPHLAEKLMNTGGQFIPGVSGWYTQLLMKNWLLDSLQREIDPDAWQRQKHINSWYRSQYGEGSWWGRGQDAPTRLPQMSH